MTIDASKDGMGTCGVVRRRGPAVLSSISRRPRRNRRRIPVGVLGGAALLSLSALSGLPFSPAGSTTASAAAPNLAAEQPAQWVTEAYTVPAAIPVDGDGNPHPLGDCHVTNPDRSVASSVCDKGTGKQRMTGECVGHGSAHPSHPAQPGDWVGPGQQSTIRCNIGGDHEDQAVGRIEFNSPPPPPAPHEAHPAHPTPGIDHAR